MTPRRRLAALAAAIGMLTMAAATLRQLGVIRHLPDPPLRSFDADKVTLSPQAFPFGVPDGPVGLAAFTATLLLARAGSDGRARPDPWLALASGALATGLAGGAAYYLFQMAVTLKTWCAYCLTTAAAAFAAAGLLVPEAYGAATSILPRYFVRWSRIVGVRK